MNSTNNGFQPETSEKLKKFKEDLFKDKIIKITMKDRLNAYFGEVFKLLNRRIKIAYYDLRYERINLRLSDYCHCVSFEHEFWRVSSKIIKCTKCFTDWEL